jgi:hypothetical protein
MARRDIFWVVLCPLVIVAATTLHEPWMIAMQAGLGGLMLGQKLARIRSAALG